MNRFTQIKGSHWAADIVAIISLVLSVSLFFWAVIIGNAWIPKGGGDLVSFFYPMYRFAAQSLNQGEIPLWNPFQYTGYPFLADNQSGVFYPFNLLLFGLWPDFSYAAMQGLVIWHFFLAGVGMYVCLRLWQPEEVITPVAALFGAIIYSFSDIFIVHIGHINFVGAITWLPWIFIGLHRAVKESSFDRRVPWVLLASTTMGVSVLAGHGQATFLVVFSVMVYALYLMATRYQLRPLLLFGAIGIIAFGVSAINLWPTIELIGNTTRAEYTITQMGVGSLPWRGLTGLLAPDFFGRGIDRFWGDWGRVEYGYVGVMPWLLGLLAVAKRPFRYTSFFVLLITLSLALALGANTPVFSTLVSFIPFLPFRIPARFVLGVDFGLAMLATQGIHYLISIPQLVPKQQSKSWGFAIGTAVLILLLTFSLLNLMQNLSPSHPERAAQMEQAILVFVALAVSGWFLITGTLWQWLPARLGTAVLILCTFLDLYSSGRFTEIEWNDPTLGYPTTSLAMDFIQSDPGIHRIEITTSEWQPALPQLQNLYSISGVNNPLQLSNYTVYIDSIGYRGSPLYNLLGVKYIISGKKYPPGDTNFLIPVYADDPKVTVYLNTRALPRVMMVYQSQTVPNHDAAFAAIHETFDPQQLLILEQAEAPHVQTPGQYEIQILRYDGGRSEFQVTTSQPGYFLLTDIHHPHWYAQVNNQSVPIYIANYLFRAVYLETGTHHIQFVYNPPSWRVGLIITLTSWFFIGGYGLWQLRLMMSRK